MSEVIAGGEGQPLVVFDPHPRGRSMVLTGADEARLAAAARIVMHEGGPMPEDEVERWVPEASIWVGQTAWPVERLDRAKKLQAIVNVEGLWRPNVDYAACEARRIPVLSAAPAMAPAVAEMCLALALDLARGVTAGDRAFRAGAERYGILGNLDAFLLRGQDFGLVGFGNLGRELLPLLAPFRGTVRVHDPWLPDGLLRDHGCVPASLEAVLADSRVLFLLAGPTTGNEHFLGPSQLDRIREDAAVVLASRAAVVDFDAFVARAEAGRFRAAIDVFPEEPVPAGHPVRRAERVLLSSHRAGGLWESYARISEMLVDDALLVLRGLPPARLQRAAARTASVARSR